MYKISIISFLLFLYLSQVDAQDRFFLMTDDWSTVAVEEQDDYYVAIGNGSTGHPNYIHYINFTKIDKSNGDTTQWRYPKEPTVYSEIRNQQSYSNYEGKRIIGTTFQNPISTPPKIGRLVLNKNLTEVIDDSWYYQIGTNSAYMFCTYQANENKILYGFWYLPNNSNDVLLRLLATDSLGSQNWSRTYQCTDNNCWLRPQHIMSTQDGGYLLTAVEQRNMSGSGADEHEVSTLIKTDSLGVLEWRIYPGGLGMPYTSDDILATLTDDGNILCTWLDREKRTVFGDNVFFYQNEDMAIWFAKIDLNGNKLWEKNITEELEYWGITDNLHQHFQMLSLSDGHIALISGDEIIKLNHNADVIWARNIRPHILQPPNAGEFTHVLLYSITETSDNGFLCAGEALIKPGDAFPEWTQTGFVIKVDEYGCLEEGCQFVNVEEVENKGGMLIYPNPVKDYFIVNYNIIQASKNISLLVTDVNGKIMYNKTLDIPQDEIIIHTDEFPAGQYFCTLKTDNNTIKTEKFIIAK